MSEHEIKITNKKIRELRSTVATFSVKKYEKNYTKISIALCKLIAEKAFEIEGTRRKYTNEPYMTHPERCVIMLNTYDPSFSRYGVDYRCALYLHDTIEDTFVTIELLVELLSLKLKDIISIDRIVYFVDCLTDKEPHDERPRLVRKNLEADRFKEFDGRVCDLKLIDSMHNFSNIMVQDWNFAITYAEEKSYFLSIVKDKASDDIFSDAYWLLNEFIDYRKTHAPTFGDHTEGYIMWKITSRTKNKLSAKS